MKRILWLRDETKPFEQRVALTPNAAKAIAESGHKVFVESSKNRIFSDEEYENLGLPIVPSGSWRDKAPKEAVILGLKELENEEFPLEKRHIYFAHCFKGQDGSEKLLNRFKQGNGKLYDLEFLVDDNQKRIAAFGEWAGFAGAAVGVEMWCSSQIGSDYNLLAPLKPFQSSKEMVQHVRDRINITGKEPKVMVIGARGRCGRGAINLLKNLGIQPTAWGSKDTKAGGPFKEILDHDLLINCALMMKKTKPFLTHEVLQEKRKLTAISDVSCDPTGPFNPLPIYNKTTTMDRPKITLYENENPLDITAIDHLPSLLPRESSEDFCSQLLPHLMNFLDGDIENSPWERSLELFYTHLHSFEESRI